MTEKENLPLLNCNRKGHKTTKKDLVKISKEFPSVKIIKEQVNKTIDYDHPAEKFIFATSPSPH